MSKNMNIEKSKRIICISLLTLILLLSSIGFSYAATRSELNDIDQKIKAINDTIKKLSN